MKLLLYCTKAKPILRDYRGKAIYNRFVISPTDRPFTSDDKQPILNGKIVAECDFEVEVINKHYVDNCKYRYRTPTLDEWQLMDKSCLINYELNDYIGWQLKPPVVYAIHIKNLHIFDKPKELSEYYKLDNTITLREVINRTKPVYIPINKAPQSMMYCFEDDGNHLQQNILISIKPEWLCKILNGEKTIEVRKKVLKEMLKNA